MSQIGREQSVAAAEAMLTSHDAGANAGYDDLYAMIKRLLDIAQEPWLTECDDHPSGAFKCESCVDESFENLRLHVKEVLAIHRKVEIVRNLPGKDATVSLCIRCSEHWPCETMAAVQQCLESFLGEI